MALLHRVGPVPIGESAVVVVASAPHRDAAFAAARFGIDTLKATVPIWKREHWDGGQSWGLEAQHLVDVATVEARSGVDPSASAGGEQ
jgi:molybdopterin synthase catalytic subunit